jgi:hypothetical protein
MSAPVLRANSELVAAAWIASIPAFTAGVSTQLPQDTTTWVEHGFVTVQTVGGSPHEYVPLRRPVVQVDAWATQAATPGRTTSKPPWFKAAHLIEWIVRETYHDDRICRLLTLKPNYPKARVLTVSPAIEPRRVYGVEVGTARYTVDLFMQWGEAE